MTIISDFELYEFYNSAYQQPSIAVEGCYLGRYTIIVGNNVYSCPIATGKWGLRKVLNDIEDRRDLKLILQDKYYSYKKKEYIINVVDDLKQIMLNKIMEVAKDKISNYTQKQFNPDVMCLRDGIQRVYLPDDTQLFDLEIDSIYLSNDTLTFEYVYNTLSDKIYHNQF